MPSLYAIISLSHKSLLFLFFIIIIVFSDAVHFQTDTEQCWVCRLQLFPSRTNLYRTFPTCVKPINAALCTWLPKNVMAQKSGRITAESDRVVCKLRTRTAPGMFVAFYFSDDASCQASIDYVSSRHADGKSTRKQGCAG